jgi:hypothetical protein
VGGVGGEGGIRGCGFAKRARDQVTKPVDGADPILQSRFAPPLGLEVAQIKRDCPKRQTATATPA